ncbi:oxidoreductase, 2OG-FeII oxygenase domain containing protein [Musa troglodytarum]|uniref:Oxidoreductase, 2OG-FeII oxygenase domain containing protein n=1 Tax=Musa troglodytarum TaxID=320322 RepID=A0A9E7G8R2_9LILI|nr:oxidoreductase, 2OG-FeII oxygenase domain containing protein [Musa troglodytarum]
MSTETFHHKLDFSGLSLEKAGTPEWERVRAEVVASEQNWFEVVYDGVAPELRVALFGRTMKELFALPVDVKMRNTSNKPYQGYIGQFPDLDYETLSVVDVHLVEGTRSFTELMWPEGNPSFWCDHTPNDRFTSRSSKPIHLFSSLV